MTNPPILVPAIPPRPPQVTLVGSSVVPGAGGDSITFEFPDGFSSEVLTKEIALEIHARMSGDGSDERWTGGFAYWPENHSAATIDWALSTTTDSPSSPANLSPVYYQPFRISTKLTASTFGFDVVDYAGRASRQLDNAVYAAIENEFWTGTIAQAQGFPNPYLANITTYGAASGNITPGATTKSNGTAVSVTKGLALLQDALAGNGFGGQGMIHCIPGVTPNLLNTRRQGKLLLDQFDNFIVPGVGYPGTGPGGATPSAGTSWMYATSLVMTRIQKKAQIFPDTMAEAVDHTQTATVNSATFRAEKLAAAYWDSDFSACVLVNLPS